MRSHLDFREKGGYETLPVTFHPEDENLKPFDLEIYMATTENPHFLGNAPLDEIAQQIATREGPSGRNCDYLFNLATALRNDNMSSEDDEEHIFELDRRVRQLTTGS